MFKRVKSTIAKVFDLNRFQQGALTVATAAASAAVLYAFYPAVLVCSVMFVIVSHEMGHFFTAKRHTRAALPVFIPFGFILVGITQVIPIDDVRKMVAIYSAGPRWGMFAGAILLVVGVVLIDTALILSSLSLACCELYSITLGSDGQRVNRITQART